MANTDNPKYTLIVEFTLSKSIMGSDTAVSIARNLDRTVSSYSLDEVKTTLKCTNTYEIDWKSTDG